MRIYAFVRTAGKCGMTDDMTWKARFYPSCMEGHLPPFGSARARAHARVERHWRDAISVHGAGDTGTGT